jgi:hypothetical protein
VQVSGFHASWRKLDLLNTEKIAPRGQIARQKGRFPRIDTVMKRSRMAILTQKSHRIIERTFRLSVTQGSPPISVPIGHSLENQFSWVMYGMRKTSPASTR